MNLLIALFFVLSHSVAAESFSSSDVVGYDLARNSHEEDLLFHRDGRVERISGNQLSGQSRLLEVLAIARPIAAPTIVPPMARAYQPTILPNMDAAYDVFNDLNPYWRRRAECYNKAQVWTYEQFQRRELYSMKVFLFFTAAYIRDYNYHWWFHVSPYVMVKDNGSVKERVLDYTFMEGPTAMQDWTDYFIASGERCKVVTNYSDYEDHQYDRYCFLIKVPMYFWQPLDIETLEKTGEQKTEFDMADVNTAYWQAF